MTELSLPDGEYGSPVLKHLKASHYFSLPHHHFKVQVARDAPTPTLAHSPPQGSRTKLLPVSSEDSADEKDKSTLADASTTSAIVDQLFAEYRAAAQAREEQRAAEAAKIAPAPERQTNPYLKHTKFQQCVEGLSWEEARQYTRPDGDAKAQYLSQTVASMGLVYQCVVASTSRWARIQVMQENTQDVPTSPLIHYQAFNLHHTYIIAKVFLFFYHVFIRGRTTPSTLPVFSPTQQKAWDAIQEHLQSLPLPLPSISLTHRRTTLEPFERLCHTFWLSLLKQTAVIGDFELVLITPLAFLAVNSKINGFRPAYLFATDLSAIKKFARFAACQKLWDTTPNAKVEANAKPLGEEEKEESVEGEPDVNEAEVARLIYEQDEYEKQSKDLSSEDNARSYNEAFREWIYHYLGTTYHTPMAWVISSAQYISRIRYGETVDAFVRWSGSTVTVKEVSTTFEHFRNAVWSLQRKVEDLLQQLTFTETLASLPRVRWQELDCDPSRQDPGYSLFSTLEERIDVQKNFVLH
ncbi:hypothetical protein COCVIDRAFT_31861 [Bipolaris victoriae FI3]|uniref:Uncharacterized protein n=1 Tax=Bipolaris victoriae (strain FI3) TaxID=930091 RepID=W7E185_BIPV3|nr:hypothetical protein COCVIDRAFT_31861 [Bipolaris victoriae FI3]